MSLSSEAVWGGAWSFIPAPLRLGRSRDELLILGEHFMGGDPLGALGSCGRSLPPSLRTQLRPETEPSEAMCPQPLMTPTFSLARVLGWG